MPSTIKTVWSSGRCLPFLMSSFVLSLNIFLKLPLTDWTSVILQPSLEEHKAPAVRTLGALHKVKTILFDGHSLFFRYKRAGVTYLQPGLKDLIGYCQSC